MAKKFVKLGSKASSFSCPTTGLTLITKQVVKLTTEQQLSKKVILAIRGGHLQAVNEAEYNKFMDKANNETDNQETEETVIYTVEMLSSYNKAKLAELIAELDPENEDDLMKLTKPELIDLVIAIQEDEEED
jgi:hypothetical protein